MRAPSFKSIRIRELPVQELEELKWSRPVLFLGSHISTYPLTNLPSGGQVGEHIYRRLFSGKHPVTGEAWPKWLEKDFWKVPFEGIWQCYPDENAVKNLIVRLFSRETPNPFHKQVARALDTGEVSAVITTNYDLAMDALNTSRHVEVVKCEADYSRLSSVQPRRVFFKIHGSAEQRLKDELVFRLEHEGALKPWKRKLLESLLHGRKLVVAGYSGRDFDICPVIAGFRHLCGLYWLSLSDYDPARFSPNATKVLEAHEGTLLVGQLGLLMAKLFGETTVGEPKKVHSFPDDVLDATRFPEWRIRILERLRCRTLAVPLLEQERASSPTAFLDVHINMLGHQGKHGQAAKENLRLARQHRRNRLEAVSFRIASAGSRLGQGKHIRALWQFIVARRILKHVMGRGRRHPKTLRVVIQLLRLSFTFGMRADQLFFLIPSEIRRCTLRSCFGRVYKHSLRLGERMGTLDDLQWIQLNADRLGFSTHDRQPLPSIQGLANLGLRGSELIPQRESIREGPWVIEGKRLEDARGHVRTALDYGLRHETWKYSWLLMWRGPASVRRELRRQWLASFADTEYGLLYRLFQLYHALGPRKRKRLYCATRAWYGMFLWLWQVFRTIPG